MRYDPITLRLFVAIAQTGSISAASARMNIALAAGSRRVLQLESDVGAALLQRRARGVTLTAAGSLLLRHAQEIDDAFQRLRGDMDDYAAGLRGTVRVIANSSSVLQFLPQDLSSFIAAHGDVRIDLQERASEDVLRAVDTGVAEVGVYHAQGLQAPAGLAMRPYRQDHLVLLTPVARKTLRRRKSVRFEEVLHEAFITFAPGTALRSVQVAAAQSAGQTLQVRIQVKGFDAMIRMVAAGLGIGVLPAGALPSPAPHGVHVLALDEEWARRQHSLVHRPLASLSRPARLLAEFLASRATEP